MAYHQRLLPAYTQLKVRQPGQGGDADREVRDLRAELLRAEAAHIAKVKGVPEAPEDAPAETIITNARRLLENGRQDDEEAEESPETKRRRVLEATRDIDADSDGHSDGSSTDESDDEEDETAELMRELDKIKRERAEQREKEVP